MRCQYFIFLSLLFILSKGFSQSDSVAARIILIGDAGKLKFGRAPVVDAVRNLIPFDGKTTVIYLGDNLYKMGLTGEANDDHLAARAILDSQAQIAQGTDARVIFIPGNHDWSDGIENGLENVKAQGKYINKHQDKNVRFLPEDGCPGPIVRKINDDVILVLYDSQWFLQGKGRPGITSDCSTKNEKQFYDELGDILKENKQKLVILASHHPLKTYGIHGGFFTIKQHIFPLTDLNPGLWIPLPVIGSVYPLARGVFGASQDLQYPPYSNMIKNIERLIKPYANVISVAGHEHTLQLIKNKNRYYIVSGAGSKKTRISNGKDLLYKAESLGFAALNISKNKNVSVDFYTVNEDSAICSYSQGLFNFSSIAHKDTVITTNIPATEPVASFNDSVLVAANASYDHVSYFHRLYAGKNYRKAWAVPVHLKVFRIQKEMGGFSIRRFGGGKQTKSLKLVDKNGRGWTIRTVDKDVEGALPEALKGTLAGAVVQDMISAQAPYGALVVPGIAEAVKVIHTNPKIYFVPDDPAFGEYREVFANKVCLLEAENPVDSETDTKSTVKTLDKLIDDSKYHVDQESILRSRLLDILIGDWDRHFDQWKFGITDTGRGKLYFPVPRDRDQAFFNSNGILMKIVSFYAIRYLKGFKSNYPNIKWFNWEERNFDRIFMNNLDEEQWKRIIDQFQKNVNDSVISQSVKMLPTEVYQLDGMEIMQKLKSRRDLLFGAGMRYYRFLSKEVNVFGSDEDEFFRVSDQGKGIRIKVFRMKKNTDTTDVVFDRFFDPGVTRRINLYGLHGKDVFYIDSNVSSNIKLRVIGGKGKDIFRINGNIRNTIYDYSPGKNFIQNASRTKNKITAAPDVNYFTDSVFSYNTFTPLLNLGYNVEDQILAGVDLTLKTNSFRKEPYATYQKLSVLFGLNQKAYQLRYSGVFNQIVGKTDLVVNGDFFSPVLKSFYGFGNESKNDKDLSYKFYHVRYKYLSSEMLLRRRFLGDIVQFYAGPAYFHYWNGLARNKNHILSQPSLAGLDSVSIYNNKSYAGGKLAWVVDNINNHFMPSRGIFWNTALTTLYGINQNSHQHTKLTSSLTVYASWRQPARVVIVFGIGGGHIFNDSYEYFQALTLGSDNHLRGFRKNRFSGQSLLYQTTELRVKLFESGSYIFAGSVGLIGFNEVGRVWVKNEKSDTWHDDFGGGIYYAPFNIYLISATVAHSKEDNLFNFSISTKFNLNF